MSKTIYKYPLEVAKTQRLELPKGAEIVSIQVQKGIPCLWAFVDKNQVDEGEAFVIAMFGTGHELPEDIETNYQYITTIQMNGGDLVLHVFEQLFE